MKVLICHERYEPDFGGGGEIIVHHTSLHLAKLGVDVEVITAGDPKIKLVDGISTTRLPMSRYRFNFAADAVAEMAQSADIIQVFNYHACLPALAAGRRTGKPVVCTMLGLFLDEWKTMRGPVMGRLFQAWEYYLLHRPYDRVSFLSEYSRKVGVELGLDAERTFVASPGVDTQVFYPAEKKDDVVLFAAKLDPRKGIDELIAVARALPNVRFQVVGWGEHLCAEPLYTMKNVEVIPFDRDDVLRQAFSRARLFFFPSRAETYGMVLVEAMASGCAIVSTIDLDYEGVVVKPFDVNGMVQAVSELWDNRERTTAMGNANAERAKEITWERYARSLLSTYKELT